MERRSHILLVIKHVDPEYRGMVPGKLYEYIGARRPILGLLPEGEAASLVADLRRGEVVAPDDPHAVASALGGFFDRFEAGVLDSSYDLTARPEFERKTRAGQLAAVLDERLAGR